MQFVTELVPLIKDSKNSDEWQTPDSLFYELNQKYKFVIDACATKHNNKCPVYFTECLTIDWKKEVKDKLKPREIKNGSVWMNPPYSNPGPFLKKAWEQSKKFRVVCLVSNSIMTCRYIDFLDTTHGQACFRNFHPMAQFIYLTKRTKFYHPKKRASSPTGGCMLIVMDNRIKK